VRNHFGAGGGHHPGIAADVVVVVVRVQSLGDVPAIGFGGGQAFSWSSGSIAKASPVSGQGIR
jgi:hypothetical protein